MFFSHKPSLPLVHQISMCVYTYVSGLGRVKFITTKALYYFKRCVTKHRYWYFFKRMIAGLGWYLWLIHTFAAIRAVPPCVASYTSKLLYWPCFRTKTPLPPNAFGPELSSWNRIMHFPQGGLDSETLLWDNNLIISLGWCLVYIHKSGRPVSHMNLIYIFHVTDVPVDKICTWSCK